MDESIRENLSSARHATKFDVNWSRLCCVAAAAMPRFDPKLMLLMKASMISTAITLVLLFAVCIYYERTKAELREHQKAARRGQTRRQIMIEHMVSWARAKKRQDFDLTAVAV